MPERDLVADPAVRGGPLQDHAHPATQRHDRGPQPQPRRHRPLHLQGGCPAPVLWCCGVVVLWCCGVTTPAAQNINYCSSINLCPGHHLSRLLSGWVRAAGGGEDHLCVRQLVRADPLLPGAVLQLPRIPGQRQGGRGGRTLVITSC